MGDILYTPDNYPYVFKPFEHQYTILSSTWKKRDWAYFMEMGTGKSKVLCDNAGLMFLNGVIEGVVVVAKKGEYINWHYSELPTHMPDAIDWRSYVFSTYRWRVTAGKRDWANFTARSDGRVLRVLSCNIEAFGTEPLEAALTEFYKLTGGKVMFAVDESTCIKNHTAKRSKALYKWSGKATMRRIMTGLPNPQSPLDIWGQSLALRKGLLGASNFTAFRSKYAIMEDLFLGSRRVRRVAGYQRLNELTQFIQSFSSMVKKEDCLDLPEKIYKKVAVELTARQKELMQDLADTFMAEVEGETVEVTSALAMLTKLHQVACGQLKMDDGRYVTVCLLYTSPSPRDIL